MRSWKDGTVVRRERPGVWISALSWQTGDPPHEGRAITGAWWLQPSLESRPELWVWMHLASEEGESAMDKECTCPLTPPPPNSSFNLRRETAASQQCAAWLLGFNTYYQLIISVTTGCHFCSKWSQPKLTLIIRIWSLQHLFLILEHESLPTNDKQSKDFLKISEFRGF